MEDITKDELTGQELMSDQDDTEEYEKVCFICRRPERKAGKMISMPNHICICSDCVQKAFDSIEASGLSYEDILKMSGIGSPEIEHTDDEKKKNQDKGHQSRPKMTNISMINLSDLLNVIPQKQR